MMMPKKLVITVVVFLTIFFLITVYLYISSSSFIINSTEKKMGELIKFGAEKKDIILFLDKIEYQYIERNIEFGNYFHPPPNEQVCLDSRWDCKYTSTIEAHKSKFGFADPWLTLNFAFDEDERLIDYSASVSYTFL